jgi:membrane associated rhomboid family serine protease
MHQLAAIRSTRKRRQARDWSLVLTSQGIEHELLEREGEWTLSVADGDVPGALRELALYEQENRAFAWVEELPSVSKGSWIAVGAWLLVLLAVDTLAGAEALGRDWQALGRIDSVRMDSGEHWRALTALCLHSGLGHLLGNLLWGGMFLGLASESLGGGWAGLLALSCGAAGNLLNVGLQSEVHLSVGASTAVFGLLGLLGGARFRSRSSAGGKRPSRRWAPIVAVVFLFLWSGVGGIDAKRVLDSRIDVEAHLGGFLSGLVAGALVQPLARRHRDRGRVQVTLGLLAVGLLGGAWALALR